MLYPYTISTSDSFVQIDTRTLSTNVLLNLSTSTNQPVTIRDIGGSLSFFNVSSIKISTTTGSFNDMTSSHFITKPYGFVTVVPNILPNTWLIQNEYDNTVDGTANTLIVVSSITISTLYTSSIVAIGPISTMNMNVSTAAIENGSTVATTIYWSTCIADLPTSGPGFGYVASTILYSGVSNMATNYTYISSTWLASLNIGLASTNTLVSSLSYFSTMSSITPSTFGYMSTIVIGKQSGFVQYVGGYNVGAMSSSGTCGILSSLLYATYGSYSYPFLNTFGAENISTLGNLKFNTILSPSFTGIYDTGTLFNTGTSSDKRIKKDIVSIQNAMEKIRRLRGVSYRLKESGEKHFGFIAQEVESVVPQVVVSEDLKRMYYGDLVALLIEGVKELKVRLEALDP
jgi:hypothetical protein